MKKSETFFTVEECKCIEDAVAEMEKATSGEIVVMVVDESDEYAEDAITAAALYTSVPVLAATVLLFGSSLWYFLALSMILFYPARKLLDLLPELKKPFIGRAKREETVKGRAMRAFYERGLHKTRDNTGVLFFLSLLEHKVWVLADKGIYEKITQEALDRYTVGISAGIREGRACDALCSAVRETGKVLAEHFPIKHDDTNELSNKIIRG